MVKEPEMDRSEFESPATQRGGHVPLLVIEGVLGLFAAVSVFWLLLSASGCGDSTACLYQIAVVSQGGPLLIIAVVIASAVGVLVLRRKGKKAIAPPIIGMALIVAIVTAANVIVQSLFPAH